MFSTIKKSNIFQYVLELNTQKNIYFRVKNLRINVEIQDII